MNYIWDLDGTLFNSYPVITDSTWAVLRRRRPSLTREEVRTRILRDSVAGYTREWAYELGEEFDILMAEYRQISEAHAGDITLMPGAKEALQKIKARGDRHFVYTHRGKTAVPVLKKLEIYDYFEDIVTSEAGFPRKPAPDAVNYLVEKHGLDRASTFYVGDRVLDMGCAAAAGVRGILFLPENTPVIPDGTESFTVTKLTDI